VERRKDSSLWTPFLCLPAGWAFLLCVIGYTREALSSKKGFKQTKTSIKTTTRCLSTCRVFIVALPARLLMFCLPFLLVKLKNRQRQEWKMSHKTLRLDFKAIKKSTSNSLANQKHFPSENETVTFNFIFLPAKWIWKKAACYLLMPPPALTSYKTLLALVSHIFSPSSVL